MVNNRVKNIPFRATKVLNVVLRVDTAASDLAASVFCNLALMRFAVSANEYARLYSSAYALIIDIINGRPVVGTVPLPIFQLLASLRARVVDLGFQTQFAINVDAANDVTPNQYPEKTANDDLSYFTQRAACLGGLQIDLKELDLPYIGPYPKQGYHSKISIGHGMGPLNYQDVGVGKYSTVAIREQIPKTEHWMKCFAWAANWDASTANCSHQFNYPEIVATNFATPGSIALSAALRHAEVIGCQAFDFPALDLSRVKAFLDSDLITRLSYKEQDIAEGTTEDLRAALAILSGAGLRAGQPAFYTSFMEASNYQLPMCINESCLVTPTFRESSARIPYVHTIVAIARSYRVARLDSNPVWLQFLYNATAGAIGISDAEMRKDASAFVNNTYAIQSAAVDIAYSGTPPAWGGAPTAVATGPGPIDWSADFAGTIGNGPLSRPSGDRVATPLNFTDLTADNQFFPIETGNIAGYRNINCFTGKIQGPNLALLCSLPLPREAVTSELETTRGYTKWNTTPYTQHQCMIAEPAVVAPPHTVTENGAAKNTEVQQLFVTLQEEGLGGTALLGDVMRGAGIRMARPNVKGTGTLVAGKPYNINRDLPFFQNQKSLNSVLNTNAKPRRKGKVAAGLRATQGRQTGMTNMRNRKGGNTSMGSRGPRSRLGRVLETAL